MNREQPSAGMPAAAQRALRQRLESLSQAGVMQIPRCDSVAIASDAKNELTADAYSPPQPAADMAKKAPDPLPIQAAIADDVPVSQAASLEVLQQEVAGCTLCEELATTRTQTVFGVGDPKAKLCFLGEAPGADEDKQGEPFVGRAGKLLDKIIEACNLRREDVYILNNLKCRPPGNRNPTPEESKNCSRHLIRQLELIQPEFICCLGAIAAQNLLQTDTTIGKLRGHIHNYRGINVVCTYHPAYLLRNPAAKKETWEDMKMLMRQMGVEL